MLSSPRNRFYLNHPGCLCHQGSTIRREYVSNITPDARVHVGSLQVEPRTEVARIHVNQTSGYKSRSCDLSQSASFAVCIAFCYVNTVPFCTRTAIFCACIIYICSIIYTILYIDINDYIYRYYDYIILYI